MIVPGGPLITRMYSSATEPTPGGGSVVPGTYDLTSSTIYVTDGGSGPTGDSPHQETFVFTSNMVNQAQRRPTPDGGCEIDRQTGSLVFASSMVTYTQVCPTCSSGNCGGMAGFTATTTTFTLFDTDNGTHRVDVYTKQ